jgi:hypothetical protein
MCGGCCVPQRELDIPHVERGRLQSAFQIPRPGGEKCFTIDKDRDERGFSCRSTSVAGAVYRKSARRSRAHF